jgi:MarR family transcriptional regulator, transcriptional regulator for hemolysin
MARADASRAAPDAMQMQKITVTRHVERLLRAGWVERHDNAADRRAYHLYLSRKAEPLIDRLTGVADQLRSEYMRGLSASRREALINDLLHIKTNLLRMDAEVRRNGHDEN